MKSLKTYLKLQRRMIFKTRSRFLSVLLITFIGTAFFAGLRITPKVMNTATDAYLDQQQYADLTLIPTYGVTAEDIAAIKKIDGVGNVEGTYFFDALMSYGEVQEGVTVYSQSELFNTPYLVEGKLVEAEGECVVDQQYHLTGGVEIGDTIYLKNDNTSKAFKIVGFVKDPRYLLYYKRGTNQYGSGTAEAFILIGEKDAEAFARNKDLVTLLDSDAFYNELCIEVIGARDLDIYSDAYDDLLNDVESDIEDVISSRLTSRYESLIADKKALLEEPLKAYEEGLAEYEKGKAQFDIETKQAEIALVEGRMQVLEARRTLLDAQSQFTDIDVTSQISGLEEQLESLQGQLNGLKEKLDQTQTETPEIPDITIPDDPEITPPETELPSTIEGVEDIKKLIDDLNGNIDDMQHSLQELSSLADGLMQLEAGKLTLDKAELELDIGEQTLTLEKQEAQEQLDQAKEELDQAKVQLDEAQAQIDSIPQPEYYLLDQNMNEGIVSFKSDSDRIGAIAQLFPLIFFLVAALVSLTTMTRMVEEQRSQSGTLRALGYSRALVMMQYISYALFATLIGSILGIFFGSYLFPAIIYGLYSLMMYDVPVGMIYCLDNVIFIKAIVIAVIVTLVATIAASARELMKMPAILMRPKAPKLGKRIVLERIPWLWQHLNFNQKVTLRNMFRYKKRFLMSIIGIAGCTALMMTGFGVKYSLTDMTSRQFDEIWLYDCAVHYTDEHAIDDSEKLRDELKNENHVSEVLLGKQETVRTSSNTDKNVETNLVVPSALKRFDNYFVVKDYKTKESMEIPEDGAIITQKLAEMLDVDVGDTMNLTYQDQTYEFVVSGIAENYIQHFVYMSSSAYEKIFDTEYQINTAYFNLDEVSDEIENQLGKTLMEKEDISSVTFTDSIGGTIIKQMDSVNIVVWVLIISAGLLAFVVLYNLTNININERLTEIATIKVLGFREYEVNDYVFRENILLSILGAFIGMFLGIFLHHFIMTTVEVDYVMFVRTIRPVSFLYSGLLTMLFTSMINRFMRRVLRRVDMVSSLKSVE